VYSLLEGARQELLAAIDGLKPEQMTVPMLGDWSVKDILAHVASWEEYSLPDFRRVAQGQVPALAAFREADVDQWNALIMGLRKNFPLDQVLHEFEYYRRATMAALDALPDERFAQGQFPFVLAIVASQHDRDHAAQIRAWRGQEGL